MKRNKHSFKGDSDLLGRMFVYEDKMKKYDLCSETIKIFFNALKAGELTTIKKLFNELNAKQITGLIIGLYFDYNDISGNFMSLHAPMGRAMNLVQKFKHRTIEEFFKQEQKNLKDFSNKIMDVASGIQNQTASFHHFPMEIIRHFLLLAKPDWLDEKSFQKFLNSCFSLRERNKFEALKLEIRKEFNSITQSSSAYLESQAFFKSNRVGHNSKEDAVFLDCGHF
jgi:hypothetical protein